jgi:glycosyltransferase involved in cell wall biosynthesis
MNQPWNSHLELTDTLKKQCENIKPIDIMVGVLCKDVETTVLNVLNVINEGLYRYFPDYRKAIVISEGNSTDKTKEVIDLFQPYNSVAKIITSDISTGGKGAGVLTILEIAHKAEAKCVVLMDGDLLSIKPGWIQTISNPIIYGRADLTVPYYIRDKNDGVITNNLVYPFTRAVYGIDIRQPIAGEFALSKNLYNLLRTHPLFPPDFGVDIFIVTVAAAEGFKVKEGLYSLKIHESTTRYLEPEKFLIPMFRRVTGSMFTLAKYYEHYWKNRPCVQYKTHYRECFSQKPIPVKIDIANLTSSFQKEYSEKRDMISTVLTKDMLSDLDNTITDLQRFDSELWAEIVYNFAAVYKNASEEQKRLLLDSLKPLWIGRFVSYALEIQDMDINQAETILQKQAEVFEEKFSYLLSIY